MIGLEITGLTSAIKKMEKVGDLLQSKEIMEDTAQLAKQYAEENCPEDTGELRKSIYTKILKDGFELGATAKHAVFNEYGCYNLPVGSVQSPISAKYIGYRPFLRPAIYRATSDFREIFGKKIARVITHG